MDEDQRDIYNRFGEANLKFDPRKDEMKLIADMSLVYLFWAVVAYCLTIPKAMQGSRTWIAVLGIGLFAVDLSLTFTETTIPDWMPRTTTEHELLHLMHSTFPFLVAVLAVVAHSVYVDIDETSVALLEEIVANNQVSA
jgi:hypothetical protein